MLKLNQIIALEKGAKGTANSTTNKTYHLLQKSQLFAGQERNYQPKDDEGERFPPEPVKLQNNVAQVLRDMLPDLTRFWDLTITKDAGNQTATGSIEVDGHVLATDVPVTTLLFLEKQLTDLATMIGKVPVLDPAEDWTIGANGEYRTPPALTTKSKKLPRTVEKAAATDKHPAQVDVFLEDQVIGSWSTIKLSGALPELERRALLGRVEKLKAAVKVAREQANMTEAQDRRIGAVLFDYLGM